MGAAAWKLARQVVNCLRKYRSHDAYLIENILQAGFSMADSQGKRYLGSEKGEKNQSEDLV